MMVRLRALDDPWAESSAGEVEAPQKKVKRAGDASRTRASTGLDAGVEDGRRLTRGTISELA